MLIMFNDHFTALAIGFLASIMLCEQGYV